MGIGWRSWFGVLAISVLASAGKCPVQVGDSSSTAPPAEGQVDLGGPGGSSWQLAVDELATVTLVADGQKASEQAEIRRATVTLLGRQIEIGDFCWRTDVVCPHQLLPQALTIAQDASLSQLLLAHSRRGPMASVRSPLIGTINGTDIEVPLGQAGAPGSGDYCDLLVGSSISAGMLFGAPEDAANTTEDTAASDSTTAEQAAAAPRSATQIQGRITLVYGGDCFTIGGSGALDLDDQVEISVPFSAERLR